MEDLIKILIEVTYNVVTETFLFVLPDDVTLDESIAQQVADAVQEDVASNDSTDEERTIDVEIEVPAKEPETQEPETQEAETQTKEEWSNART